jgi:Fe(3+) dicitrate transport protein
VNLVSCQVDGRLRAYTTLGIDSRLFQKHASFGLQHDLEVGVKLQSEVQQRRQERYSSYTNYVSSTAMSVIENQERRTQAISAFASNRTQVNERLAVTPILRVEQINYQRNLFVTSASATPTSGNTSFTEFVPGVGATYELDSSSQMYGGVHKGFSPPRVEDAINSNGGSVNLNAESSINAELGLRSSLTKDVRFDVAVFRNDFSNLVQVGSIAGGSTAYSEGKALFQGLELAGQADRLTSAVDGNVFARIALTWLPTAEQKSAFNSPTSTTAVVNQSGKRLPYAPEHLLTLTLGYRAPQFWNARVEYVHVSEQYASFDNQTAPSADGQKGLIDAYGLWNAVLNYTVGQANFFVAGKNLGNATYIVDRTRGIQVGMPRTLQVGMKYAF